MSQMGNNCLVNAESFLLNLYNASLKRQIKERNWGHLFNINMKSLLNNIPSIEIRVHLNKRSPVCGVNIKLPPDTHEFEHLVSTWALFRQALGLREVELP